MKIVVLNTVLSNTGDAAIYQSIVEACVDHGLALPGDITALDSAARVTSPLYPGWSIEQQASKSPAKNRVRRKLSDLLRNVTIDILTRSPRLFKLVLRHSPETWLTRPLRALASADIVLSSGGTYLVDHYRFRHRVREIALAKSLKKPVVLWTQSMGPFTDRRSAASIRTLAKVTDAVYFRDERSKEAWKRVARLPVLHAVLPDTVFGLVMPRQRAITSPTKTALLSVRSWGASIGGGSFSFETYTEGMRSLAEQLLSKGWRCVAISTCQGVDGYSIDDSATARVMFDGLDVEIDASFHTPQQLFDVISGADLVVSTRMHLAILSLIAGTPVNAVAYENKSIDLFRGIGADQSVTPIEEVTIEWGRRLASLSQGTTLDGMDLERLRKLATQPVEGIKALTS